jgi:hypothetical protein
MRVLKSESFEYNDDKGLVNFVNKNSISKNDIQQIVANDCHIMLYYWEEEKETANVSNHAKPKHFYMFQNDELNYNFK